MEYRDNVISVIAQLCHRPVDECCKDCMALTYNAADAMTRGNWVQVLQ